MGRVEKEEKLERRGIEEEMLKMKGRQKRVEDEESAIAKGFRLEVTIEQVISDYRGRGGERVLESDEEVRQKREVGT